MILVKKAKEKLARYITSIKVFTHLKRFYKEPPVVTSRAMDISYDEGYCELIVVAFNNSDVIEYQIKTLRKFFRYPFRYTVFDNSTDYSKSERIRNVCKKEDIGYVCLPRQSFVPKRLGSISHGIALNYIFRNYMEEFSHADIIGILDHDIFCIEEFDISHILKNQPFYGLVHHRSRNPEKIKYIWPGMCFLRKDIIQNVTLDFRPSIRLAGDTGVRLYETLYSKNVADLDSLEMV